jgi:hypothetical protein
LNDSAFLDDADGADAGDVWSSFLGDLARAADHCLRPWRHGLRFNGPAPDPRSAISECCLMIEARDADGQRHPERDLELEIYRSGDALNLTLSLIADSEAPMLWHGNHPVWMQSASGERCERPADGIPLEAFCRRVRALLASP